MVIEFQYQSDRFKPDVRNSPDVVRVLGVDDGFRHDGNEAWLWTEKVT